MMMYPDLSGLVVLAIIGILFLLVVCLPLLGAAVLLLLCRIITGDWIVIWAYIGAAIGIIPAIIAAIDYIKTLIK